MTMNVGFGFDAELNYRQERLRADFRRTHTANRLRWWQRRPAAAVAAHRTGATVGIQPGAGTVTATTVGVAPDAMEPVIVRSRPGATNSTDVRAHAA